MLTAKQEAFCLAYLELSNGSAAYRKCYSAGNMKDESVRVAAAKMLADPNIKLRIDELRAPAVASAQMTVEQHLADLKEIRDAAISEGKFSAAATAEVARGKVAGFYVERAQVDVSLKKAPSEMTDEELAEIAAGRGRK